MYLLVRKWTGSSTAAYIAGLCFCLAPLRFGPVVGQPHILATQYYPLILLTLDQAVRGRIRAGVVAGLLIALQCLVSFYLAYQVLMIIGALLLAVVVTQGFSWITKRSCAALLLAGLLAVIPVVAVSLPYLEARAGGSITAFEFGPSWVRGIPWYSLGTHVGLMASALGIAALPFLVHAWISGRLRMAQRMLACVMICLAAALLWRGPILSLPSWLDPYSWLATVLPGFSSLRGTQRFAVLGSFGLSVLAGFSVAGGLGLLRRFSVGG